MMGRQGGHSRFLTGISMFVSIQPPDQHLPGHPLHRWEQILRPVSLPKWWDAVGCDPAPRQLGPHGLLQVGRGGAVSSEQVIGSGAERCFHCTHTPPPQDQAESSLPMLLTHTGASSHYKMLFLPDSHSKIPIHCHSLFSPRTCAM